MNNWLRILLLLAVFAHGIGHILFLMPFFGISIQGQSARSWLLTNLMGDGLTRGFGAVIWVAVILAYLFGLYGFFTQTSWWPQMLVGASGVSAIGLLLFWANSSPIVSAFVFDLVVILALQVFKWPVLSYS
jgi:hypothetical protein